MSAGPAHGLEDVTESLRRIQAEGWIVHFLVNGGALACNGAALFDGARVGIDVSAIDPQTIASIDTLANGIAVCVEGNNRCSFVISELRVSFENERATLSCVAPQTIQAMPSRRSDRRDIADGEARIRLAVGAFPLGNLSEGGCSFLAPSSVAKHWPPGEELVGIIECVGGLQVGASVHVVRIQYDMAMPPHLDATVSCRFSDQGTSRLAEAALRHLGALGQA